MKTDYVSENLNLNEKFFNRMDNMTLLVFELYR